MENMNPNARRGVPVKMIWFLITIAIYLSCIGSMVGFAQGRPVGRLLESAFYITPMYLLLAVGAGLCMARGCINLSLPGTMAMSMMAFGLACRGGVAIIPATLLAILTGAAYGALNGIFTIQRGRNIQMVTALSSLLIGLAGSGFAGLASDMRINKLELESKAYTTVGIVFVAIAIGVCFLGAIGGKKLFHLNTDDEPEVSGGNRFLWSVIAGILAGLAGIFQAFRTQQIHFNFASDYTYLVSLFFILITAGILIPNVRRTYGEALFGLLAIVFATLAFGVLNIICMVMGTASTESYIIYAVFGLLLLIPNLLIYKKRDTASKES